MHGPREGTGEVGLLGMRVERLASPIGLGSIGEQGPFHALEGQQGSVSDPQVQHPSEVRRAAFKQIVLRKWGEYVAAVLYLYEPQRHTQSGALRLDGERAVTGRRPLG